MAIEQYETEIFAPPEKVFAHMDNINNVSWHMSGESSMPMMGGRLKLEVIDDREGVGRTYRWKGSVMGMKIDIKETVTKWVANRDKTWKTIEHPKMIVLSRYTMHLLLTPTRNGTFVVFEIDYDIPKTQWGWVIGKLLARKYAKWCLQRACEDAKKAPESRTAQEKAWPKFHCYKSFRRDVPVDVCPC
jgi:hypothetical protein